MDARRWQSPAVEAAAAEAADEDAGGAGGPSRRPPRRGLHRASPYGLGPRRWLPKVPVASRIFPAVARGHAAASSSDNNQMDRSESLEVAHKMQDPSAEPNTIGRAVNNANLPLEGDYRNQSDGSGLAKIENIIKQNQFSRDETEHLIEIIRLRTPELSDEDHKFPRSFTKSFEATPFSDKWSTPAKPVDIQSSSGNDMLAPPNVHDVSSSPIELAKAYMEAQTSASLHESQKRKFRALSHGVDIKNSSSTFFPKVTTDSPVRWPGSVVRDNPKYLTPQSNKGRTLPLTSSRTNYTGGSVFPTSYKHSGHHGAYDSSGQPQLSTPFSVGSKAILEDKMASTGSVLAVQPSTSSKGVYTDTVGTTTPFFSREGSAATKNGRSQGKGTAANDSTLGCVSMINNISNSKCASVSVHPKSSKTANKILQHLERTVPSPASKPLELRLTSAKRTALSAVTNIQHKGPDSITSNSHTQSRINGSGSAHQDISDAKVLAPLSSSNAEEFSLKIQNSGSNLECAEMPCSQQPLKSNSTSTSAAEVLDKSTGNGFAFTFPVNKTSSSLAEPPPTPTLSLSPATSLPAGTADMPKFTIGSLSPGNRLNFSFDLASTSVSADETVPTFKYGCDKERELSFDFAGKDAVCF